MYVFGSISHAYFEYSWHMHVCMYLPIPNMHTLNISGTCVYLWVPNVHGCAAVCIPLKSAALVSPLSAFHECCLTQASCLLCMVGAWRCVLLTYSLLSWWLPGVWLPGDLLMHGWKNVASLQCIVCYLCMSPDIFTKDISYTLSRPRKETTLRRRT